jgi:hypothetical protein
LRLQPEIEETGAMCARLARKLVDALRVILPSLTPAPDHD